MLTLSTLVAITDRKIARSAQSYRIGAMQRTESSGWTRYDAIVYGGSRPARPVIQLKEEKPESLVRVECSCTYFTMNLETVLALTGNAQPQKAQGLLPVEKNPKMKPGLCPHLYTVALALGLKWKETQPQPDAEEADQESAPRVNDKLRTLR